MAGSGKEPKSRWLEARALTSASSLFPLGTSLLFFSFADARKYAGGKRDERAKYESSFPHAHPRSSRSTHACLKSAKEKKTGSGWLLSTRDSQHRKLFTLEILLLRLKFLVHLLALSRIFFKSSNVRLGCCSGLPVFFSRSAKILGSSRGNGLNLWLTQPFFFRGGFRCLRFPWW